MKRSKKALALFLALVMCIGVLAGCGGGNNTANNGDRGDRYLSRLQARVFQADRLSGRFADCGRSCVQRGGRQGCAAEPVQSDHWCVTAQ